jgi:hypothetical protein
VSDRGAASRWRETPRVERKSGYQQLTKLAGVLIAAAALAGAIYLAINPSEIIGIGRFSS